LASFRDFRRCSQWRSMLCATMGAQLVQLG
jgi:hypothetical protein